MSKRSKNCHFWLTHSHLTLSLQWTPANICINLILLETKVSGLHFATDSMGLTSFAFLLCDLKCVCKVTVHYGHSRSTNIVDFSTSRKCTSNFLLVITSNLGPILHRFGDTLVYWSKNRQNRQFVPTIQSHKSPFLAVTPIEFRYEPDISRN